MKKGQETKKYLTPAQLAAVYQVTDQTIRRWHREGKIPAAVALGTVIRFDADEVAETLRASASQPEAGRVMVI